MVDLHLRPHRDAEKMTSMSHIYYYIKMQSQTNSLAATGTIDELVRALQAHLSCSPHANVPCTIKTTLEFHTPATNGTHQTTQTTGSTTCEHYPDNRQSDQHSFGIRFNYVEVPPDFHLRDYGYRMSDPDEVRLEALELAMHCTDFDTVMSRMYDIYAKSRSETLLEDMRMLRSITPSKSHS